jgi:hypothetical protein
MYRVTVTRALLNAIPRDAFMELYPALNSRHDEAREVWTFDVEATSPPPTDPAERWATLWRPGPDSRVRLSMEIEPRHVASIEAL